MVINLRKLEREDLPFLLEVRNNILTRINLENDSIFTLDECKVWFNDTLPEWYIIESYNTKVGYLRTNGDEIGCDIHPNHRRKGYAREAYNLFLKEKNYASLWVFEDNFAKILYTDLGFIETEKIKLIRNRKYVQMEYTKTKKKSRLISRI